MRYVLLFIYLFALSLNAYAQNIFPGKNSINERFLPPQGYVRRIYKKDSFQYFLRNIPLKKYGVPVFLFDGSKKENNVHISVLDIPLLRKDLIQCADAIILLRAHFLFRFRRYGEISFSLTNGMQVPFSKFARGYRIKVKGNEGVWKKSGYKTGYTREIFDEYLQFLYAYAGTVSLSKDLKRIDIAEIDVGDVFIHGGHPGHAVIVMDLAENKNTGEKVMLLAQSFMPSQEIHILKSFADISPWYNVKESDLITPEWHFKRNCLKRF